MKPQVSSRWEQVVLVCRKCSKRQGGGFGPDGRLSLAKALRRLGGGKGRKARLGVIETKCLGVCPKHAVVAIGAAHPGEWLLVRPGTPVEEAAARLGTRRALTLRNGITRGESDGLGDTIDATTALDLHRVR